MYEGFREFFQWEFIWKPGLPFWVLFSCLKVVDDRDLLTRAFRFGSSVKIRREGGPYLALMSSTRNKRRAEVSFLWDVDSRDSCTDPHNMMADCMWYVRVEGLEIWSDVFGLLWQIPRVYRGDCRHVVMCRILLKIVSLLHCDT